IKTLLESLRKFMKLSTNHERNNEIKGQGQRLRGAARSPVNVDISPSMQITESKERQLARKYEGKLLLRHEIHLDDKLFSHLINKQYFTAHHSLISTVFSIRCVRCNNRESHLFARYPCAKCQTSHMYCRKCIMMGRVSTCEQLYE